MAVARGLSVLFGVLMAIAGFYCMFTPGITYAMMGWLVGFAMLVDGISVIITWVSMRNYKQMDGWALASGIISLVLGIIILCSSGMQYLIDLFLVYLVALWVLVVGIIRIVRALNLRKLHNDYNTEVVGKGWVSALIIGILLVVMAVLCFIAPGALAWAIGFMIGLSVFIAGVNMISVGITF